MGHHSRRVLAAWAIAALAAAPACSSSSSGPAAPTAEEQSAFDKAGATTTIVAQTIRVTDRIFSFDPDLAPDRSPDENARTLEAHEGERARLREGDALGHHAHGRLRRAARLRLGDACARVTCPSTVLVPGLPSSCSAPVNVLAPNGGQLAIASGNVVETAAFDANTPTTGIVQVRFGSGPAAPLKLPPYGKCPPAG